MINGSPKDGHFELSSRWVKQGQPGASVSTRGLACALMNTGLLEEDRFFALMETRSLDKGKSFVLTQRSPLVKTSAPG